jgi:hypothetical protein
MYKIIRREVFTGLEGPGVLYTCLSHKTGRRESQRDHPPAGYQGFPLILLIPQDYRGLDDELIN